MTKREVSNDEIMTALNGFSNDVNKRFDAIDDRFDAIDKRFDEVDKRLFKLEQGAADTRSDIVDLSKSYDRLTNTVDKFIARIDHYEVEQAARDRQFERPLAWAHKVSAKTGIPLEDF